jgi:spore germination protein GerM
VRSLRILIFIALFTGAAYAAWWWFGQRPAAGDSVTVYYTKLDGQTEVPWRVSLGSARDLKSVAFYTATQALAGPAPGVDAIRFPAGTHVSAIDVEGSTIHVDISKEIDSSAAGGFAEDGEFKSLVWTLTALPNIKAVRITIGGVKVATLPGGHFELDEPLSRSSW